MNSKKLTRALQLAPPNVHDLVANGYFVPKFCGDHHFTYCHEEFKKGTKTKQYRLVDMSDGTATPLFNHKALAAAFAQLAGDTVDPCNLPFERVCKEDKAISFEYKNYHYTWAGGALTRYVMPPQELAKSPDGLYGAYTRHDNLYIKNMETDELFALTSDGKHHNGYGGTFEGNEAVIKEKLAGYLRPAAVIWSPNGKKLITCRIDERKVKPLHLVQSVTDEDDMRPVLHSYKYALPRDNDTAMVQLYIFDVETRTSVPVLDEVCLTMIDPLAGGFSRAFWSEDSKSIICYTLDKGHQNAAVYHVDGYTGKATHLFTETSDTFLFFDFYRGKFGGDPRYDKNAKNQLYFNGKTLLWNSCRDGYYHIYEYDITAPQTPRQITHGQFNVRQVLRVDWENKVIYLTAAGVEEHSSPYKMKLYACDMESGELTILTPDEHEHIVNLSPDGNYLVDNYSTADEPAMVVLRDIKGKYISTLLQADAAPLNKMGISYPMEFTVKDATGKYDISVLLVMPNKFDPTKKYPIMDYYYGGNQTTNIPRTFYDYLDKGYLTSFADMGFVGVIIDGKGTPFRSKEFHDYCYKNMGSCCGMEDHVAAFDQLCERFPFLDRDNISVWGHSGGGFAAYKCMVTYPEVYKCAAATGGNHMQELYISGWSERFMNEYDKDLWRAQNSEFDAHKLDGPLLLIHGELDDNVHPANTMRLVQALIKADKDFDFLLMPGKHHLLSTDKYYQKKLFTFFAKNVLEK